MPLRHLKCLLFLLLFVYSTNGACQTAPYQWDWAKEAYTNNTELANDVAVDPITGDVVVVGEFTGDISAFYGSQFVGAVGGGFVARYNASGTLLWAFRIGGNDDDRCESVAIDASGNIYVTGYVTNFADFRGNAVSSQLLTSAGGRDAFLIKYNSAGLFQWGKLGGGTNDDEAYSVAVGGSTVYVTGYYNTTANFGVLATHAIQNRDNVFLVAYNATTGNELWLADGGVTSDGYGYDVIADANNVYVTGSLRGNITFYNGAGVNCGTPVTSGNWEGFTASYTNTGNFNWASIVSGGGVNKCYSLTLLGSSVYITGSTQNNTDFTGYAGNPLAPPGTSLDFFIAQLNTSNGFANWVVCEAGNNNQEGLQITNDGTDIIVCGSTESTLSFISGPTLTSLGSTDVFVAKYTTSGSFVWAQQAGGASSEFPYGIASITAGDIYVVGEYRASATFGTFSLFNEPSINIFVANLSCAPISNNTITSSQTICSGQTPATLVGSTPIGGSTPYVYLWEESADNISWSPATLINNTQNYSPPSLTSTKYYRRTVNSSGGCPSISISTSILITVDQPPTIASAGVDQTICSSSTSLLGNTATVGSGIWTLVSGTGTIVTPTSPTTGISGMSPGINTFQWAISSGSCPGSSDQIVVTVDAPPTIAAAGNDQTICSLTTTLLGNNATVGTGVWTLISGTGTITSPTLPNSGVTGLTSGANVFQWTISNGTCPSTSDQVIINVTTPPTTATAGIDQNICSSSSSLQGNTATVGTGLWTLVSGTGTITVPTSPTSGVTGMSPGNNIFQWTITSGTCPTSFDQVTINVSAPPTTASAGIDQTICSSSTSFSGNTPTIGTGTWTLVSGTGTITTPSSPTSGTTGLSQGANVFQWTITSGTCPSSFDQVTINVVAQPTTAAAGNDQTICSSSTSLQGNIASVGTGVWTLISGTGNITTPTSPTSGVTGMLPGANVFQWTITNGICPVSLDQVTINVDPIPTVATAGTDQTICSLSTTLLGNTATSGTGIWTLVSGTGTITTPTSPTSGITAMSQGANVFQWTITSGSCPSSSDQVTINAVAPPTIAAAGIDQTICSSSTSLQGNTATVGTGLWTLVSGTGTITTPTSSTSAITAMSPGANIFQWTITNGICPASFDQVTINVDPLPTIASVGTDQTICSSSTSILGNAPTVGSGTWSLIAGTGTITSPTSPATGITGMSAGANVFQWTMASGTCPSSFAQITINVDPLPTTASVSVDQTICSSSTTLIGNTPTVGTGAWSLISGTGTITAPTSPTTGVTGMLPGANVFQWTISNGTCPSSADTIIINVDAVPTAAIAGADHPICSSNDVVSGNIPTVGTGLWTLVSGTGTITNPTSASSTITNMLTGTNVYVWTISNGTCPASSDSIAITVDSIPSSAFAGIDQVICMSQDTLEGNVPTIGTGMWGILSGSGIITSITSPISPVTNLFAGTHSFVWTISNGSCPSSSDTVTFNVDSLPNVAYAGLDSQFCSSTYLLNANTPTIGTGVWNLISGSGTIALNNSPSSGISGLSIGANVLEWTITNGTCPSTSDTVVLNVDPTPTTADAGVDQLLCSSNTTLYGNTNLVGTGVWNLVSGSGTITSPNSPTSSISALSPGANIFEWTITSGTCPPSTDQVWINVEPTPTVADAGPDQIVDIPLVVLGANTPQVGLGYWEVVSGSITIPNPFDPNCVLRNVPPGHYVLRWAITGVVCDSTSDEVEITVNEFVIPNGFSPNDDAINDYFVIPGVGYWPTFNLNVYNRWGELVYLSTDYQNQWNGQNQNGDKLIDDTYYYVLEIPTLGEFAGFVVVKREN